MLDPAIVESQAEVLRSDDVALAVVRKLKLADAMPPVASVWTKLLIWINPARSSENPQPSTPSIDPVLKKELEAARSVNRDLRVTRVARTNLLQVVYSAPDPVRAAEVVNAYASSYVDLELNRRTEFMQRAQAWLQSRSEELRRLSGEADSIAQKFRSDHNLLSTRGVLITDQQLSELATQLVSDGAATAQAGARYQRIKEIIDKHQTNSAVTEALTNPLINELRTKYLEASKRRFDLQRKLGSSHTAVVTLEHSMDELDAQLFREFGRIAESYKNEYEIAAARERTLYDLLAKQQITAIAANDALVQLRQLEQSAENYRTLSQNYTQLYEEAGQQKGIPLTSGHVVSEAHPPLVPSQPRKMLVLAVCAGLGLMAGIGTTLAREALDPTFRTSAQVRAELGLELIGMLPALPAMGAGAPANLMRYSLDNPLSGFAETLRAVKVAADLRLKECDRKIIGVVSLLPNEGKTFVAKNLASLLARQGARALLIDADLRLRGLTRSLPFIDETLNAAKVTPPMPHVGVQRLLRESDSGLEILPCDHADNDPRVAEGISPAMLRQYLQGGSYEYVIVDLPPLGPVATARSIAPIVDVFLLVVKWGATPRGAVRAALEKDQYIKEKLLGVILNNGAMERVKLYEHSDFDEYYRGNYGPSSVELRERERAPARS